MEEQETFYKSQSFTTGSEFTAGIEGPAVDRDGNLYVVNFGKEGTIGKVTPEGQASLFIELPAGSTGNGIRFDSKGNMMIADYTGHNVLKVDMASKELTVYAHHEGLNQPNDLAIMDNDIIFASDPNWKNSTGQIWRVGTDGKFVLLESDMGTTNGIEVSPDNKTLYVNESVQRNVWAYDLSEHGEISNKRLLIQFEDFGMDGMRVDTDGNLFITRHGKGTVVKLSPQGEVLEEIEMSGKKPSNIAFGGKNGKTAYVTLQDNGNIDFFRTEKPGREFKN
ncbi:SMP-30/gluconolactonase/LRE family protein [Negadavirga shengliensis]|uniref:SMP-30/gluconolactonase/LRE family protein n=1 Tax=Negadavirga shengliensis TaxID=1389218 RepID=A0ABV9SWA4_9BACT